MSELEKLKATWDRISQYEDNWNSYGAAKPTPLIIERGKEFGNWLCGVLAKNGIEYKHGTVIPITDKIMDFTWSIDSKLFTRSLSIQVHEDPHDLVQYTQIITYNCDCCEQYVDRGIIESEELMVQLWKWLGEQ